MDQVTVRTYVRVSTDEQALSGYSLQAQTDHLARLAQLNGWSLVRAYRDDGFSAKDMKRPGLQELLREANAGDVILVYKLDRLTRSVRDLDELLRQFEQRGLMFRSATEQFETATASGRLFLRIVTEIAEWERETIAERSAMGKRKKVELGEWGGGPVPFGYRAEPSGKVKAGKQLLRLVPDPTRAHLVAAIFERYLSGHGSRSICVWLNDELGARTAQGARWRVSTLIRLLANPIYCGDLVHGRRTRGTVTRVPGDHQPLVPRGVFAQVETLFARRKQMAPRQATNPYPLAGVAGCGVCGGRIDGIRHRTGSTHLYRCRNYVNGVGCGGVDQKSLSSFPGEVAEGQLVAMMAALPHPAGLSEFLAECETEAHGLDRTQAESTRLECDLAHAEAAIRRWDRAYESGGLKWNDYLARVSAHRDRIAVMTEQLIALNVKRCGSTTPLCPTMDVAWLGSILSPRSARSSSSTSCGRFRRRFCSFLTAGYG